MRSLPLFLAAFLNDAGLYLVFAALPFRALELGAGPVGLGWLPTLYAGAYMFSASQGGRLSDRVPRLTLARVGCLLFAGGCLLLSFASSLATLYASVPTLGLAMGCFWAPIQAAVSERVPPSRLPEVVATFNISWSLGKGAGLILGGLLVELATPQTVTLLAVAPVLITAIVLPRRKAQAAAVAAARARETSGAAVTSGEEDVASPRELGLAWMTNAIAFGLVSTVNMHAPKFLLSVGSGPSDFGLLFGSVFGVQTITFLVLARFRPGRSSSRWALSLGVIAVVWFVLAPSFAWRLAAAVPFGIATGIAYEASLRASLRRPHGRGRATGMHEAVLGAGTSSMPLLAGAAASATGSLAAPFWVAGGVLAAGFVVAVLLRPRPRAAEVDRNRAPGNC